MATPVEELILSVRAQIPDKVATAGLDGSAFTAAELLRWANDAITLIAAASLCIQDWYAVPSESGQDVYEIPDHILTVEQLWYDNWPCWRSPELDALFVSKVSSRSYYFGPHSQHQVPRLHVWPAADRTSATTTLSVPVTATDQTLTLASVTDWREYGYAMIENELMLYRTLNKDAKQLRQLLRAQGGTKAAAHARDVTVKERNIWWKGARLPVTLAAVTDPIELPRGLWTIAELYVLSKCRNAEQEHGEARSLMGDFDRWIDKLAQKAGFKGLRQGIQVRTQTPGPGLYYGRVFVP